MIRGHCLYYVRRQADVHMHVNICAKHYKQSILNALPCVPNARPMLSGTWCCVLLAEHASPVTNVDTIFHSSNHLPSISGAMCATFRFLITQNFKR